MEALRKIRKQLIGVKVFNNRKHKRLFSNGFWIKEGIMFPWENRKYLQVGFIGFVITIQYGELQ